MASLMLAFFIIRIEEIEIMNTQAKFRSLQESEKEDWQLIFSEFSRFAKALPDRVMAHLKLLEGDFGCFPVDRTHTLCKRPPVRFAMDGMMNISSALCCTILAIHWGRITTPTSRQPFSSLLLVKPIFG